MKYLKNHYKIFFSVITIFILIVIFVNWNFSDDEKIKWGVTFSKKQAEELDLNWIIVFGAIVDEMPFKLIRLPIYWPDVEKEPGVYDFSEYKWMVEKAAEKGINIMPVLGRRVPRWPECHVPEFYKNLSEEELRQKILLLITEEINYFKDFNNIKKWQLVNEPFADFFGECPQGDEAWVKEQLKLLRSLDARPIVITESGELSSWTRGARLADILGTSMYRQTWNKNWGWFNYPLPPAYYYFKAKLIQLLTGVDEVINTELQVEPWTRNGYEQGIEQLPSLKKMNLFDQMYAMDLNQVKNNIEFAKKAGLGENYLWGIEWWWWLGENKGIWEFWQYGKTLK